jgi:hypothetical protein
MLSGPDCPPLLLPWVKSLKPLSHAALVSAVKRRPSLCESTMDLAGVIGEPARLYPPRQKLCGFRWPVSRQGHRGGCPSVSAAAGVDRSDGIDRQRHCQCPAVLLQGHAQAQRSCQLPEAKPAMPNFPFTYARA